MRRPTRRELVLLLALGLAAAGAAGWWRRERALAARRIALLHVLPDSWEISLRIALGPSRYSQYDEELLIRHYFQDRRGGFFVDVGASHYRDLSTTYYLERHLGWRGIGIDAQEQYAADYAVHRPATRYVRAFVTRPALAGQPVEFHVAVANPFRSSGDPAATLGESVPVRMASTTLDRLLEEAGVTEVDLLSMDIETGEPDALAGFSIRRWRPELVCVEMLSPVREAIEGYMAEHRYVRVPEYGRIDPLNAYFVPAEDLRPLAPTLVR